MTDSEMSAKPRAAEQARRHAHRSPADYDDEGRPAASRARDAQRAESDTEPEDG
jgi:hypothetical protein